ncbi:MAG: EamA family transporter [Tissierellia bacterium]|nr:EamA family transporter [Tissierellia bacterium]
MSHYGELAAITAALIWTSSSELIERKGKDIAPVTINFYRMIIAFFLVTIVIFFVQGTIFPNEANISAWL